MRADFEDSQQSLPHFHGSWKRRQHWGCPNCLLNFSAIVAFLVGLCLAFAGQEGVFLHKMMLALQCFSGVGFNQLHSTEYDFPGGSDGKASVYNEGNPGLIPGLGRSPGEGNGNPLQDYCLENPMDRGAWQATVHGVAKGQTRLSNFTFFLSFH